jgi:hypothetical protein
MTLVSAAEEAADGHDDIGTTFPDGLLIVMNRAEAVAGGAARPEMDLPVATADRHQVAFVAPSGGTFLGLPN